MKLMRAKYSPETKPDRAAIWFALCAAWFFLLRVGEYAWSNGWDYGEALTGADVTGKVGGRPTANMREADEVIVWFKAS